MRRAAALGIAACLVGTGAARGQQAARPLPQPGSPPVAVAPGAHYGAGGLHRMFLGGGYRDLWVTPIEVPVLDLARYAGGLTPSGRGGFGQTTSLHLLDSTGRRFNFRSVDKDPSRGLPSLLRGTFVDAVVQDQISALHPEAALVAQPLVEAAGVLHASPELFVMPDDPALSEYRAEFAGLLGLLEVHADEGPGDTPGFAGSASVVGTDNMFDELEADPRHRVDARDFLAARLVDLFMGDRDRHSGQWRWARFEGPRSRVVWRPVPEDRDQAFFGLGGVVAWVTHFFTPQFVAFGEEYPNLVWATWNGRGLDRRLLVELDRSAWDSVAAALQARLSDSVIEHAVRQMPAAHLALNGPELERRLKRRRDALPRMAGDFYALLAKHVDIHATDADELAEVTRLESGEVDVRLYRLEDGQPDHAPYYHRLFDRRETKEIRLFLHGGDDHVVVRGRAEESILLHIVGGGGDDVLADSSVVAGARRRTRFYDARGRNTFVPGPHTVVDREERTRDVESERFSAPEPSGPFGIHSRNWGSWLRPAVWTGAEPDIGVFFGGGLSLYRYGFRKVPYRYHLSARAGYAFSAGRGRAEVRLTAPALSHALSGEVLAVASGIEVLNFYGFGNETPELDDDLVLVEQQEYAFLPTLTVALREALSVSFGPVVKVSLTELDEPGTVVAQLQPFGTQDFGQVGLQGGFRWDTRDRMLAPSRGLLVEVGGVVYAPILTVDQSYGRVRGEARTYLTPGGERAPTLALRAGGEKLWGPFPFFESAFLGGTQTVRGFARQRFAGDGALYGSAEVRLPLLRHGLVVPGEVGVLGIADAGRVFLDGEDSNRWHTGFGGGVWFTLLDRANTLGVSVVVSDERVGWYAGAGFAF